MKRFYLTPDNMPTKVVERFFSRLPEERPPDSCWEITGPSFPFGYGRIDFSAEKRQHSVSAHRVSYMLFVGPIPEGLVICHRCDNPPCCNPDHLFLGTFADNANDMAVKGRSARGAGNWAAKLTEANVREIRSLYRWQDRVNGIPALARRFGISDSQVHDIIKGKSWKHVK